MPTTAIDTLLSTALPVPDDLILVGHVTGAYGLKGWVRISPYSADADALLAARHWWMDRPAMHDIEVMQSKMHGDDVVAQLVGVAQREAAEALKGSAVHIRRSHFPALSDDEFYWVDLIGMQVENLEGEQFGTVVDLMDNGAHPILRVGAALSPDAAPGTKVSEILIPFVEQFVRSVDQQARRIVVDWSRDF